jgi:hypothetical protein
MRPSSQTGQGLADELGRQYEPCRHEGAFGHDTVNGRCAARGPMALALGTRTNSSMYASEQQSEQHRHA